MFQALFRAKLARQGEVKEREQRIFFFMKEQKSSEDGRDEFSAVAWKLSFRIGVGSSFHQAGTVNENFLESDFVPLCDGTTRRRSLADLGIRYFRSNQIVNKWRRRIREQFASSGYNPKWRYPESEKNCWIKYYIFVSLHTKSILGAS